MNLNIFQKIETLIFILIIILICVYFVPYHGTYNGFNPVERSYHVNKSYHSNLFDEGYGSLSYFRFLFYLGIPSIFFYFLFLYLNKMNVLDSKIYKKIAKRELYIFFVFIAIILGSAIYLYGSNKYFEIKAYKLKSEILELEKNIQETDESQYYKHQIYSLINDYRFSGYAWGEDVFDSYLKNDKLFLNSIYKFLKENDEIGNISELNFYSKMKIKTPNEISMLENKRIELMEERDSKLKKIKNLTFYDDSAISFNIISNFLICFSLLYVIRPLVFFFKEMIKEVR